MYPHASPTNFRRLFSSWMFRYKRCMGVLHIGHNGVFGVMVGYTHSWCLRYFNFFFGGGFCTRWSSVGRITENRGSHEEGDQKKEFRAFMKDPFVTIKEKPSLILTFSIPLAIIVFVVLLLVATPAPFFLMQFTETEFVTIIDDYILIAILIAVVPYAVYYIIGREDRIGNIDDTFPDFTRYLGSSVSHNLTLIHAVEIAAEEGKSYIDKDIKMLNHDIQLGERLIVGFRRFARRLRFTSIDRMVILIDDDFDRFAFGK